MNKKKEIKALKGQIVYSESSKKLKICENGYLVYEANQIKGVYPTLPEEYEGILVEDYGNRIIVPGFVDLHVHAPQYAFRGLGMDMELLDWLGEDLSLNISRETLQKDGQVKLIRNSLEKKIKNELHAMLVNDREKYETFWKAFGRQIKFGIYGDYGMHKDLLSDLLMFYSAKEQKLITLDEYIEKMPEGQKAIYFAAGDEAARLGKLPNAQLVLSKGYDLLLCSEDVDEFCLQIMHDYKEKEFKNINSGDLGLETEEEKKAAEETATENKDLFEEIKKALNGKIKDVKVNPTLQDHPVSLSSEGGISMEMEKILRKMPAGGEGMESTKVLELNPNHAVFGALKAAHEAGDTDKINKYAELLYDQALLIEGLPLEDPVAYAQLVCDLMK